jgi:hypothetical protein
LISVNERQYQLPFCQVLAAEGETILYVSTHGPFEKGKDIITRTSNGTIHAYQLKAGNIGVGEWRAIYGEIVNLVELAIELPGHPAATEFIPYIVTNGEVTDAVLEQVRVCNVTWEVRGIGKALRVVQKGELLERFFKSHGAYLPRELTDFRTFLELVLHDGTSPAEKTKASQLIEHVLPKEPERESALNVGRAASSVVLLTAYIVGAAVSAENHWCVFEYWVLAGAYILYLAERSHKAEARCDVSFSICKRGAQNALELLAEECETSKTLIQGFPLTDGHTYRSRVTILTGLISAWSLSLRIERRLSNKADFVQSFLAARLKEATMWGESAVPYLFLVALECEQNYRPQMAEGLIIQIVREISNANGQSANGKGLPSPYYSAEEALKFNYNLDFLNAEQFVGRSYSIATLVDFLARRWRRQALASLWFGITRISLATYLPATSPEWFLWKSSNGVEDTRFVPEPQSWKELRENAESMPFTSVPPMLIKHPVFALWFVLVYPQRLTPSVAKFIESTIWKSA